jgi:small subunit ribosomal protein S16
MAAKIRLKKVGRKGQPSYRIVVLDGRKPRDAKVVADLGHYDPKTDPATFSVDQELALKWLRDGAKATKAARDILSKSGVMAAWDAGVAEAPAEEPKPAAAPKAKKAAAKSEEAEAEKVTPKAKKAAAKSEETEAEPVVAKPEETEAEKVTPKAKKAAKSEEAEAEGEEAED